ncbi:MAG TPA: oligosaccharide flippase family protein [Burkholderiaceae bacterium]|nr:oligosaccharide flippase family protein [Burkholderiaceae bacterium]
MLGRLLKHTSTYTIGNLLLTAAGLVSFPILTRAFTVADYGILGLVGATLTLLVACAKLGIQQSVVRFYAEVRAGKRDVTESQYFSTVLLGMGAIGAVAAALWAPVSQILPAALWNDARVRGLLLLTSVLVLVRVLDSAMLNILRAQQRSTIYTVYSVVRRYAVLGAAIAAGLWVLPGLRGFYAGTVVLETCATVTLMVLLFRQLGINRESFSPTLFRSMVAFGIPMIAFEIGGILLNIGDRYVIQARLGADTLGVYSAAYNLCEYVEAILINSFGQAITPMIARAWEESGPGATQEFIEQVLHFYLIIAAAIVAGLAATGAGVLEFLASSRYAEGQIVIPLIIAGRVCDGALPIFAAGLFLQKRTRTLMLSVVGCAVLNLALNLALVPVIGMLGSAFATLVSYFVLAFSYLWASRDCLPIRFPLGHAIKCGAMGLAMYLAISPLPLSATLSGLATKMAMGALLYVLLVVALDRRSRQVLLALWARRLKLRGT